MFLVEPAGTQGEGKDGLQVWEVKTYWDTAVLEKEVRTQEVSLRE